MDFSSRALSVYWCPWCVSGRCAGYARGFEAWRTPPRGWWASPTLQTAAGAPTCAFPFGPCFCASRPGSCCMLGSGARLMTCGNSHYNLAVHPPATNEVCQYYQSALCGSNFLVCCVLLWPRMPQLLATTVFGLQGRFWSGFDVALASTACLMCMPACIAWHRPLYRTVLRPLVPPGTSGPTLD